jgi:protein-disulfide isomerase
MSRRTHLRERREKARRKQQFIYLLIISGVSLVVAAILILPTLRPVGEIVTPASEPRPMAEGTAMGDPNAPVVIQ